MPAPPKPSSTNSENRRTLATTCVVNDALMQIGARWKMQVLYFIANDRTSFAALKHDLPGVSDHVLATRLRELTAEGLVDKVAVPGGRHTYRVTPRGHALLKIIATLCEWARED